MELATLVHQPATGWTSPPDPRLDSQNTLVLVFGPPEVLSAKAPDSPMAALVRAFPHSRFASAATPTVAHDHHAIDGALVVCIARFTHTTLRRLDAELSPTLTAERAGRQLARSLCDTPGLAGVLVLASGPQVNGPDLVRGLAAGLPASLPLVGGLGVDAAGPGSVLVIGLYGTRVQVARGCRGGSVGFGQRRLVTRAQGQTVEEIDNQPALQLYRQYLGRYASGLPEAASHFPLTVFRQAQDARGVIRYVMGIDAGRQTIDVAGDIPAGSLVQLSRAGRSELLDGADQAAVELQGGLPASTPVLALVVSCVGRRHVLGEQTEEELEPVMAVLPPGSALAGFYSFGEISSSPQQSCDMHNMTLTLAAFWEA